MKRKNICDDKIFLNNCGKGLGKLYIAYVKGQWNQFVPKRFQNLNVKNVTLKLIAKKISINTY
jgi:hypothetical protein